MIMRLFMLLACALACYQAEPRLPEFDATGPVSDEVTGPDATGPVPDDVTEDENDATDDENDATEDENDATEDENDAIEAELDFMEDEFDSTEDEFAVITTATPPESDPAPTPCGPLYEWRMPNMACKPLFVLIDWMDVVRRKYQWTAGTTAWKNCELHGDSANKAECKTRRICPSEEAPCPTSKKCIAIRAKGNLTSCLLKCHTESHQGVCFNITQEPVAACRCAIPPMGSFPTVGPSPFL